MTWMVLSKVWRNFALVKSDGKSVTSILGQPRGRNERASRVTRTTLLTLITQSRMVLEVKRVIEESILHFQATELDTSIPRYGKYVDKQAENTFAL